MDEETWLEIVCVELIKLGFAADVASLEAEEIWDFLSDHGKDLATGLAYDPIRAAHNCR